MAAPERSISAMFDPVEGVEPVTLASQGMPSRYAGQIARSARIY